MQYEYIPKEVKSPLRYPGGKTRGITTILPVIPSFSEYREPFLGGGSVYFAVKQRTSMKHYIIGDINYDLFCFWKELQNNSTQLISGIETIRKEYDENSFLEFTNYLKTQQCRNDLERAIHFFIMNRTSFSGLSDSGGYSKESFMKRFTQSSINRLSLCPVILCQTKITNNSYEEMLFSEGDNVFIFLDPPYEHNKKNKLYGQKGNLHITFDHELFASNVKEMAYNSQHKWLITLNDSPKIRDLFSFAYIYAWQLQYGMNNYRQGSAKKGKEILISPCKLKMMNEHNLFSL